MSMTRHLRPLPVKPSLSNEECTSESVLTLAYSWRFFRVIAMAKVVLECLDSLTSLEKIRLGRDVPIPSWAINGFVGLVQATSRRSKLTRVLRLLPKNCSGSKS